MDFDLHQSHTNGYLHKNGTISQQQNGKNYDTTIKKNGHVQDDVHLQNSYAVASTIPPSALSTDTNYGIIPIQGDQGRLVEDDWVDDLFARDISMEQSLKRKVDGLVLHEVDFLSRYREVDPEMRLQMMENEGNKINSERLDLEAEFDEFYRKEWIKEKLKTAGNQKGLEEVLSQISQSKDPDELYHYADYIQHKGKEEEKLDSLYYFKYAAFIGHKKAQVYLGRLYFCGLEVRQDYKLAYMYFKLAAKQQQPDDFSQNIIGILYNGGFGVEKNREKAVKNWTKAAQQGNFNAHLNLLSFSSEKADGDIDANVNAGLRDFVQPVLAFAAVAAVAAAVGFVWKKYKKL